MINPPFTILKTEAKKCHPPLGLAYLAAAIRQNHQMAVIDAIAEGYFNNQIIDKNYLKYGLSFDEIKKKIADFSPDVVGISFLFSSQARNTHEICSIVKSVNKKIIVVLGGAHPSAIPQEALSDRNVDFVIIGDGESAFKKLLESIESGNNVKDIDGLGFRQGDSMTINKKQRYEESLDSLAFPYWDIFPLDKYSKINSPHGSPARNTPFMPVITSRGCPFECIFCSIHNLWGRKYRARSAENVLAELNYLKDRFGIKEVLLEDDNLTLDNNRARQIFQGIIDQKINVTWSTPNGVAVQTIDDDLLKLMKKSGCYSVSIGVESGDEHILNNLIKKPITYSKAKSVIKSADRIGLETVVFFVVGLPGEGIGQLNKTFKLAAGLKADNVNFFFACPLPGTRLLQLCREQGLVGPELDYERLKSDQPYFDNGCVAPDKLIRLIALQQLKLRFYFLLRHPLRFLRKLWFKLVF